ncbi:MAG: alpha/beta fold hydrolase [Solirubrobacteraceae bacterium]|nr:alpha/beta fold hydrolase [Patulibacter sp.]
MAAAPLPFDDAGAGPAILLIHGHPFDRTMWAPQLRTLSDEFRLIAPDLPGYGAAPPRGRTTTMRAFADDLIALLDHLELASATVVGLSMGGLVAMELGLGDPDRIDRLVLAATTAAPVTPEELEQRRATADRIERDGILDVALDMAGRLFGAQARRDPEIVGPLLQTMIRSSPAGAAAALRGRAERPDYRALLPHLTVPSLVIAGDDDAFASEAVTQELIGALPGPEVVRIAGSGHLPNLELQDEFDAALRAFVR